MVWTQPDWYAGTATAHAGGDGAGSALTPSVGRSCSITRSVLRSTLPHDLVDLDGVRQVMHEEHQHEQADEEQGQREADREPRVILDPLSRRHPDGEQAGRAVGERGDEDAQHHLVGPVPQEVAQ